MAAHFPDTSLNLLSRLKLPEGDGVCDVSWKRFVELYHAPLKLIARSTYRHHTGGVEPGTAQVDDAVAQAISDFFQRARHHYDPAKGKFRTYLRTIVCRRVVDLLRRERPLDCLSLDEHDEALPDESSLEREVFYQSLLGTLLEDLRNQIPFRTFEVFERVKLKNQSAVWVGEELGLSRAMVDRHIHKAMKQLRTIARHPEYQEEFRDLLKL